MNFNKHWNLRGEHAFLSASKWHWVNYDDEKLIAAYTSYQAVSRGTELHEFASKCIELGQRLPDTSQTLNMYVNDAIGYRMTPEQVLFYSTNCFGTADAISFRDGHLRIHDLKTGVVPAHMEQLMIYAGLFCLEYDQMPGKIDISLCIYQNDDIVKYEAGVDDIAPIMEKIVEFDKLIDELNPKEV